MKGCHKVSLIFYCRRWGKGSGISVIKMECNLEECVGIVLQKRERGGIGGGFFCSTLGRESNTGWEHDDSRRRIRNP